MFDCNQSNKRPKYDTKLLNEVPVVKRKSNILGGDDDDDDDDDDDEFLIDFNALSSPERGSTNNTLNRSQSATKPESADVSHSDESESVYKSQSVDAPLLAVDNSKYDRSDCDRSDVILKIANDGLLATLHLSDAEQVQKVKQKFSSYNFPQPSSLKSELKRSAQRHLPLIKRILHGKHKVSIFYDMAKQKQAASEHQTITNVEKLDIDWRQFCGGYYGFKRQYYIASVIENSLRNTLRNSESRNRTIEYWTIPSFTAYVLANEVIIRLVMKDMAYNYDQAEALVLETSEYGYTVSDTIDLDDDLEISDNDDDDGAAGAGTGHFEQTIDGVKLKSTTVTSTTGSLLEELYNSD
ncbi:Restriction of telomere capping protein 4 [Scheffersomyces spartinae]|uniref:Restriction of telomere capping protein 4 n=1 Tax=Scheffersomyces spartinae TaxID=45513 RepID=A0A9P7V5N4_9ASCO|nr:Restriction of telomere capping protein 4 [Scheffersomyces spartinae]KAG7191842.1 Restriction of telomere capping protein 4 [Scheffersomyces spartinae]